ncbi:MAG: tetratricopeptide repeat protein [Reyranella sp.]|uniref:tetratricopeptide repeat protein n=1 Tax=Reyranella sp. TaxID=1929291 RepID=UPI001218F9EA|nr:tetratricopeptide repeat protein [Reyranella sp.]TAJ40140.1 MAG: tetratricopeptide repeat protein [Reyranella sp.]
MLQDRYGNDLTTTSTVARDAYLAGVDSLMAATPGMDTAFQAAVTADEGFALGHISLARAKQLLGRGHEAKAPLARARELAEAATPREQSQIAIFEKILTGQGAAALEAIHEHMKSWPRDAMALAPATSVFGLIGFSGKAGREVDQLALLEPFERHYGDDWWYRTQLAFAQIELQMFDEGQRNIDQALAGYPSSAHAAHIRGHLFYELGEREAGLAFLTDWMSDYPRDGLMHCHNSWHLALWSLETGRTAQAWRIYDDALSPAAAWGPQVNVATDCAAFLARAEMAGEPRRPERWRELADYATKWFPRTGLGFVDMHTALAYAMAGDGETLAKFVESPRGATADMLQPMASGFEAFAQGNWVRAAAEIEPLLATHERLGGSRAQRDLLEYLVTSAMLRAGRAEEARSFISRRRPQNGRGSGFPLAGL